MGEGMEERWRALSEEVLTSMKDWRIAHPQAIFREIEEAVHERMSRLEAQMLQETALASTQTDWQEQPVHARSTCPHCGTPLQARGKRPRQLQSRGGQAVTLNRRYGTYPACGMGLPPKILPFFKDGEIYRKPEEAKASAPYERIM
jgi:hypothetical protein